MFILWTKKEFGEEWEPEEFQIEDEVRAAILRRIHDGKTILLTTPYTYKVKVDLSEDRRPDPIKRTDKKEKPTAAGKEEPHVTTDESGPEEDKSPGD